MAIRVKAELPVGQPYGWYGFRRRRNGEVFEIEREKDFSSRWMKKVSDGKEADPAGGESDPAEEVKRGRPPNRK